MTDETDPIFGNDPPVSLPPTPPKKKGWPAGKPRGRPKAPPPRAAAAEREPMRVEPLREPGRTPLEHRLWDGDYDVGDQSLNRLNINKADIPEGFDMVWVTTKVRGMPFPERMQEFARGGWEQVHTTDFQGKFANKWTPQGYKGPVEYDEAVLCARPMALTIRAKARALKDARDAVKIKEDVLRSGDLKGVTLDTQPPNYRNSIKKSLETIAVPDE